MRYVAVLLVLAAAGCQREAKREARERPEPQRPEPVAPQPAPVWHNGPVEANDLRVEITGAQVGDYAAPDGFKTNVLMVHVSVTNRSPTRLKEFRRFDVARAVPVLMDNFGNSYRHYPRAEHDPFDLRPGHETVDVVLFDPPVAGAAWLHLTLPGEAIGSREPLRFDVPLP